MSKPFTHLYRIHTEASNGEQLALIHLHVGLIFDGYSINANNGVWRGTKESSVVVEIYGYRQDAERVKGTAIAIKLANKQESVLVASIPVEAHLF